MKKRLLIINTGGTISMRDTPSGMRPDTTILSDQLAQISRQWGSRMPEYTIREYEPLLDSANFCPADWLRIANDIVEHYQQFDAFLVLHGTDTMVYTASALAFMLRGLDKNVILTGSQLPLSVRRNDAHENLITAIIIATEHHVPEVCILFGSLLLRGCRATKISANSFDAFDSPNALPLATIGTNIRVYENRVHFPETSDNQITIEPIHSVAVATLRLFPGINAKVLENVLQTPLQCLILEAYGSGNGPSNDRQFLDTLKRASDRGVVIVNLSQCRHGSVSQQDYATGRALADSGLVSGHDMTVEAALTKLMYLFSCGEDVESVRRKVGQNLVGELTPANDSQ